MSKINQVNEAQEIKNVHFKKVIYDFVIAKCSASAAVYKYTEHRELSDNIENSLKFDNIEGLENGKGFPALKHEWILYHTISSINKKEYFQWAANKVKKITGNKINNCDKIDENEDLYSKIDKYISFYDQMSLYQLWGIGY